MINKSEFRDLIQDIVRDEIADQARFRIATVASADGKPTVTFAGEDKPSGKGYSFLNGYTPSEGDRVLMVRVKGTYVILDKLITSVAVG